MSESEIMKRGPGNPTWVPGQGGNPNGRPKKGQALTDALRTLGNKRDVVTDEGRKIARKKALAEKLWALALAGDLQAIKLIIERLDGLATQHIITEEKTVTILPPPKPRTQKPEEVEE